MDHSPLEREFARCAPWYTRFWLDGQPYGGQYEAAGDIRVDQFFECFPQSRTILELGSFEAGHTLNISKRPGVQQVVGVEGRRAPVFDALNLSDMCIG